MIDAVVRKELEALYQISQKEGEPLGSYISRLVLYVDEQIGDNDEAFEKLTSATQDWLSITISKINEAFVGTSTPKKGTKQEKPPKKEAVKEKAIIKKQEVPHENRLQPKKETTSFQIKRLICNNPNWTLPQVKRAMEKEGLILKEGSLNTLYSTVHSILTIMKEISPG